MARNEFHEPLANTRVRAGEYITLSWTSEEREVLVSMLNEATRTVERIAECHVGNMSYKTPRKANGEYTFMLFSPSGTLLAVSHRVHIMQPQPLTDRAAKAAALAELVALPQPVNPKRLLCNHMTAGEFAIAYIYKLHVQKD